LRIKKSFEIDAPASRVWEILGERFTEISAWTSGITHSEPRNGPGLVGDAEHFGRVCQTDLGEVKEKILEFDRKRRILAYAAQPSKLPSFVRDLQNRWVIGEAGPERARVEMDLSATLTGVMGALMGPMIKLKMGGVIKTAIEELCYYAERGEVHPRVRKAASKAARKKLQAA